MVVLFSMFGRLVAPLQKSFDDAPPVASNHVAPSHHPPIGGVKVGRKPLLDGQWINEILRSEDRPDVN